MYKKKRKKRGTCACCGRKCFVSKMFMYDFCHRVFKADWGFNPRVDSYVCVEKCLPYKGIS